MLPFLYYIKTLIVSSFALLPSSSVFVNAILGGGEKIIGSLKRFTSEILWNASTILWLHCMIWYSTKSINNSLIVNILVPAGNYFKCDLLSFFPSLRIVGFFNEIYKNSIMKVI